MLLTTTSALGIDRRKLCTASQIGRLRSALDRVAPTPTNHISSLYYICCDLTCMCMHVTTLPMCFHRLMLHALGGSFQRGYCNRLTTTSRAYGPLILLPEEAIKYNLPDRGLTQRTPIVSRLSISDWCLRESTLPLSKQKIGHLLLVNRGDCRRSAVSFGKTLLALKGMCFYRIYWSVEAVKGLLWLQHSAFNIWNTHMIREGFLLRRHDACPNLSQTRRYV